MKEENQKLGEETRIFCPEHRTNNQSRNFVDAQYMRNIRYSSDCPLVYFQAPYMKHKRKWHHLTAKSSHDYLQSQ